MLMHPDDRVLVAIMNNLEDWQRVQDEHWYRIPVKFAPSPVPNIDWVAFFFTSVFDDDRWAVHYFARVEGHELLTRRNLLPAEPNHPRAGHWYYKLELGSLFHRLPPIIAGRWRRVTFIFTTGDRFEAAVELRDLLKDIAPDGRPFVTLRETDRIQYRSPRRGAPD
jgi:hypothetical protein